MSDSESDPRDFDPLPRRTGTRKRPLILSAAGVLSGATVVALIIGGGAKPPRSSERIPVEEIIVKNAGRVPGGMLDEWQDHAPDGEPSSKPSIKGLPVSGTETPLIAKTETPGEPLAHGEPPQRPAGPVTTGRVQGGTDLTKSTGQTAASHSMCPAWPAHRRPVSVSRCETVSHATRLTKEAQGAREITRTPTARRPFSRGTITAKTRRHDPLPKFESETLPFGRCIEETVPVTRAVTEAENPAPHSETPEGIPLRTDIPPGTSPLDKNGPDKPLWTRPEQDPGKAASW